ncbi:probable xyloglucan endotransglucosylase/hydrolase protein 26 [Papaver somniferum]|uniref:probable xyloglucan endotransglucosylase/hydrolase protein 26 n=1 Tax=Papaver somniferum TaxID=3469 RepID=UPI000E6FCAC2|nr:probable xyloglucan endotransglucosylase/hydrolase protein 26 [Papaver somniferum]
MIILWGKERATIRGANLELVLVDKNSGSAAKTKAAFLFGSIEMLIKLVPGNSAGVVTTFYLSSTGDKHDEIDFEFLGNVTGQPYTIHTNVYAQGKGNREEQFVPWYDPSAAFHNYTIHWNPSEIVWYVDRIPIPVYRNYESEGVPYPNKQGMRALTSLWNADDWATRGGRDKTDWTQAPFKAQYRRFRARACKWKGAVSVTQCASKSYWFTSPVYSQLTTAQKGQMDSIRNNNMIYAYCNDTKRFGGIIPKECSLPQF